MKETITGVNFSNSTDAQESSKSKRVIPGVRFEKRELQYNPEYQRKGILFGYRLTDGMSQQGFSSPSSELNIVEDSNELLRLLVTTHYGNKYWVALGDVGKLRTALGMFTLYIEAHEQSTSPGTLLEMDINMSHEDVVIEDYVFPARNIHALSVTLDTIVRRWSIETHPEDGILRDKHGRTLSEKASFRIYSPRSNSVEVHITKAVLPPE